MTNWTQEQIEHLNRIQRGNRQEGGSLQGDSDLQELPRTCPNRSITPHHDNGVDVGCLLATKEGWLCPDCGYIEGCFSTDHLEPLSNSDVLALGA
ncbi:hypothetical protein [Acidithiobacillus sulfurivorans]|uniref:HNH endonuclease n=1 Tax=Acidithiobacillus sulfurivorans TaxID=1958756 RepID=A0ABS6A194_9PROT|nr:hypothetical protein [Acidithiobacillus sulfurivorans]MBU2761170.1 hypothetical protein [Acidithiobacillus sulfurivorans]